MILEAVHVVIIEVGSALLPEFREVCNNRVGGERMEGAVDVAIYGLDDLADSGCAPDDRGDDFAFSSESMLDVVGDDLLRIVERIAVGQGRGASR